MLIPGKYYTLTVSRNTDFGQFLVDDDGDEILLPNRYVTDQIQPGDPIEVFVYTDSEDRPVATTEKPFLQAGQAAYLEAVDKTIHGAFFRWGVPKDLFVPIRNQINRIDVGKKYIVYMYVDQLSNRLTGTTKLNAFIRNEEITVTPGQEVDILIALKNPYGYRVVIDHKHRGMIYTNQIFTPVAVGDQRKAYVARITEDNRIDLTLQKQGYDEVKDSAGKLLELLRQHGGILPVADRSAPEEVYRLTQMSKKVFKRAVGTLLKQDLIEMEDHRIVLKK
ncbi:MAG: S1-like domain-containing RNA-binding protein [Rikenellaceae bacterium]|nr:S1-like domain-containing RNA-binding protein [Rikenellaceae bacterium]